MMKLVSVTLVAITLSACATTSKIKASKDEFSGGNVYQTDPLPVVPASKLKGQPTCGGTDLCIQFKKVVRPDEPVSYEAIVSDGGEFAPPVSALKSESLQFRIEGKVFKLSTDVEAKSTETVYGGMLTPIHSQTIPYGKVEPALLVAISQAKEIRVLLKGNSREKVGFMPPIASEAIKNLISSK